MRIAVVSDIHGNRTAFQAVLSDLRRTSPDLVIHGGDLANGGSHPAEIVDQIQSLRWPGVQGNADEALWAPQTLPQHLSAYPRLLDVVDAIAGATRARLGDTRLQWLKALPRVYTHDAVTVVHASPESLWQSPLSTAADAELKQTYGPLSASVVVYGHIHCPYIRPLADFTVANSGSVSLSLDGDPRASYLLLDGPHIEIRRIAYDLDAAARDLAQVNLPHASWVERGLREARYVPPPEQDNPDNPVQT